MRADSTTLDETRRGVVAVSPALPFITFYDDSTGERIELSALTFDNWVAKTANFLTDELDIGAGDVVRVRLPAHWITAVWLAACAAVGAPIALGPAETNDAVVVVGPDEVNETSPNGIAVVACSLRPMGARFASPLPPGITDFGAEVLGFGDYYEVAPGDRPTAASTAFTVDGQRISNFDALARSAQLADEWFLDEGGRLLVNSTGIICRLDLALSLFAVPAVSGGSVVIVGNPDPTATPDRMTTEQITATADL